MFGPLPLVAWVAQLACVMPLLGGCNAEPPVPTDVAAIESVGILAGPARQAEGLATLQRWSRMGSATASRELALAYRQYPDRLDYTARVNDTFTLAAEQGDAVAAFMLGEAAHRASLSTTNPADRAAPDVASNFKAAWHWYEQAARLNHAEAALMLGRMAANGEGRVADARESAQWLFKAARLGSAQAMFLLFTQHTQPGAQEAQWAIARHLLVEAAHKHYPPAMHALGLALQGGQYGFQRDDQQAAWMMKEASEESRNRWNAR